MSEDSFYSKAADYWANVPATIEGMLGGYGRISDIDIEGSKAFLNDLLAFGNAPDTKIALDCGAGIGRVALNVLIPRFETVDLVEQNEKFLIAVMKTNGGNKKLGSLYNEGLQNFAPKKKYDIIWCQWVLCHLNDYDLVAFLARCGKALNNNGFIVIKENVKSGNEVEYDEEDSSVARPYNLMQIIFKEANLMVVKEEIQDGFPDELYPVYFFALTPNKYEVDTSKA